MKNYNMSILLSAISIQPLQFLFQCFLPRLLSRIPILFLMSLPFFHSVCKSVTVSPHVLPSFFHQMRDLKEVAGNCQEGVHTLHRPSRMPQILPRVPGNKRSDLPEGIRSAAFSSRALFVAAPALSYA